MPTEPIAGAAMPSRTVTGLGVCDVLRVELQPIQVPGLIDELEERRGPLEEELHRLRASCPCEEVDPQALEEREYEPRLVLKMRAQLPARGLDAPVAFVGPSGMVCAIVRDTMRSAIDALSDLAHAARAGHLESAARLREAAAAAHAWVATYLDCRTVEAYSFDPGADPARAW